MTLSDQGSGAARSSAWRMNKIMADPVVTHRGTIYPWHCDHMGHMNVMWYVGKFDEATWHLLASAGLTGKRMREEGIAMVAVEQRIEYKRELLAGDLITIRSWFQEVREKALLFVHEMANEETGEIAARTFLTGVCLDAKTRKARPLPADVRERIVITFTERVHDQESRGLRKQEAQ
jgi:acyl-CoA thioester hydrolase